MQSSPLFEREYLAKQLASNSGVAFGLCAAAGGAVREMAVTFIVLLFANFLRVHYKAFFAKWRPG